MTQGSVLLFISMIVLFIGIITLSVLWMMKKMDEQKRHEREALQAFQKSIEQDFKVSPQAEKAEAENQAPRETAPGLDKDKTPPVQTPLPPATPSNQAADSSPALEPSFSGIGTFHLKPDVPVSLPLQLISHLKNTGLFESEEGPYFPLDPSGEAILIKLKKNKTALVVPRFESEHFLLQALKRFDYVFLILSEKDVLVLNKYTDFIAGHFDLA